MRFNFNRFLGMLTFLVGAILILNSYNSLTGLTIFEEGGKIPTSLLGIITMIFSFILLYISRDNSGLEQVSAAGIKLVPSQRFLREIRKHPRDQINATLRKIGTGQAHEHPLTERGSGHYAARVGNHGRIIYKRKGDVAEIEGYNASHNYDKLFRNN